MKSCCHSCPKAAYLNEVSSLPHRLGDGKQYFEKISCKFKIAKEVFSRSQMWAI